MAISPSELRTIPLFDSITDDQLGELTGTFERLSLPEGTVLFEAGSEPEHFLLLVSGEVALQDKGETRLRIAPIAAIGELGAVTALPRNSTAVTTQPSEVWRIGTAELRAFFEKHGDVAFPFYHNLVNIVADKVRRDTRRLDEMRSNLIRTQKAMKRLLEQVLESEETPLSKAVCETLEDLIEHNRRGHYLVEPSRALSCSVRLDGGAVVPVTEISEDFVRFGPLPAEAPAAGAHLSFVLVTPAQEIPLSGTVERAAKDEAQVKLDMRIAEYSTALAEYLARVQLFDFVV